MGAAAALAEVQAAREQAEAAKKEVEEAVQAVEAQEAARNKKIEKLQKKIANADGRLSQMKVNTAKNELAQVEGEDPLPLRKAKLTQKAALKKQSKMLKMVKKEEKKSTKASCGHRSYCCARSLGGSKRRLKRVERER